MANLKESATLPLYLSEENVELLTVTNGKASDIRPDNKFLPAKVQDC